MSRKELLLTTGRVRLVSVESSTEEKTVGTFVAVTETPRLSSCLAVKPTHKRRHKVQSLSWTLRGMPVLGTNIPIVSSGVESQLKQIRLRLLLETAPILTQ